MDLILKIILNLWVFNLLLPIKDLLFLIIKINIDDIVLIIGVLFIIAIILKVVILESLIEPPVRIGSFPDFRLRFSFRVLLNGASYPFKIKIFDALSCTKPLKDLLIIDVTPGFVVLKKDLMILS